MGAAIGGVALSEILSNPIMQVILPQLAAPIISRLFGSSSPYENLVKQQAGAMKTLMPQLQNQAAGMPTAATQAQMNQLSQEMNRMQQAYSASASRQGITGTTPARAQQGRLQGAKVQAMGNILGNAQTSAQQTLAGLAGSGMEQLGMLDIREEQSRQGFYNDLAEAMKAYSQIKENKELKARLDPFLAALFRSLTGGQEQPLVGTGKAAIQTPNPFTGEEEYLPGGLFRQYLR